MISTWIYVREKDNIPQIEEIIKNICTIIEFEHLKCVRLIATATEMMKLHIEHFSGCKIHFELIEEDGQQGLKLIFRFKGGIKTLEDGGIIIKELLPTKEKLSQDKLQKIQTEFTKISEKDMVDLI